MARGVLKWLLYLVSAGLIFLGIVFIISTNLGFQYFLEGTVFISVAILIVYFGREKKPVEVRQTVDLSGPAKVREIRCPNCGAILNPDTTQVIDGKPYMRCSYCGNKFEITEEPTW